MEKMHRKNAGQCNAFFRKFLATIVHLSRAYRRNSIANTTLYNDSKEMLGDHF